MVRQPKAIFHRNPGQNHCGTKLYQIRSELWKDEWIDPGENSTRVRNDKLPATVFFYYRCSRKKGIPDTLAGEGRWLWFNPDMMMVLIHRRGGSLIWHTEIPEMYNVRQIMASTWSK